jgi:flavin reductase (DIM6/NTAB) family NADH-FMN oxidoreductase RutF
MCQKTIKENSYAADEFAVGGFTPESCRTITAPRIKESFLALECSLEMEQDLSQKGISSLIIGKIKAIALNEDFAGSFDSRYGEKGFMFNIHQPKHPLNAKGERSGIGVIDVTKKY